MSDLIRREDVLRLAESGKLLSGSYGERAKDIIKSIPTAEPKKVGYWIKKDTATYKCSECGKIQIADDVNELNYCCCCGSNNEMKRSSDET